MSNQSPQPGDRIKVSEEPFIIDALRALEVFKALISTDEGRRDFADAQDPEEKEAIFNRQRDSDDTQGVLRRAQYKEIPEASRGTLEGLRVDQLKALADVDAQFVADGLWVHVPSPGFMMIH